MAMVLIERKLIQGFLFFSGLNPCSLPSQTGNDAFIPPWGGVQEHAYAPSVMRTPARMYPIVLYIIIHEVIK
jgi:hypothetical protein